MNLYYFNKNKDSKGNHEVHTSDCSYLPALQNKEYIGSFSNCSDAIKAAKTSHPSKTFDGCYYCCKDCHKG